MADGMGIALYQRFSSHEASLFLRCPIDQLESMVKAHSIAHIDAGNGAFEFFGYQLVEYLITRINERVAAPVEGEDKVLRTKEVVKRVGLSRTTIWRREQAGDFPRRIPLGENSVGWLRSDIDEWLRNNRK